MEPKSFYTKELKSQSKLQQKLQKLSNRWATLRVLIFVVMLAAIVYQVNERAIQQAIVLTFALVVLMVFMVKRHVKIKNNRQLATYKVNLLTTELQKLKGDYSQVENGTAFSTPKHPYSSDLDIVGKNSIYQLLNQTTSYFGASKLAKWLLSNSSSSQVLPRQQAAKELAQHPEWCLNYRALGMGTTLTTSQVASFKQWLHQPSRLLHKKGWLLAVLWLPILFVAVATVAFVMDITLWITLPLLVVELGLLRTQFTYASNTVESTTSTLKTLQTISGQLQLIEQSDFKAELLTGLKATTTPKPIACREIKLVSKWLTYLEARKGSLHILFNVPFLLDIRWLLKIEDWKHKNATYVETWWESLATMECLISLSSLYFTKPTWTTPNFSTQPYYLHATNLVHPLLGKEGVANDVALEGSGKTILITGPNMAGKSTYLRAIATNMVLAQLGAPVRASSFTCHPETKVYTAMRVKDDLSENISSFYAELSRIKELINRIRNGENCLYFLDEILKGTNSADRFKGAKALLQQLHKMGASGFISTHDIELGRWASSNPYVQNFSFESDIIRGKINFDYKIKKGICTSFNASELMRQMGIEME